tara:strand:+ start:147 stop:851 length:705 start_codon:yes stop_codon:yes gene_type:complete
MSVAKQLYDLLGIDLEIEGHSRAIADVEIALSDNRLVLEAEKSVEDTRVLLIKQETKRKDCELIAESAGLKASQVEVKLYGGTVKNPRELQDLQVELNSLLEQKSQHDESLLEALEAQDDTEKLLARLEGNLSHIKGARNQEEKDLKEGKTRLEEEMRQLEVERIGASDLLATEHLMLYMNLRSGNVGGAVVAKVERGSCQGCRITLPTRVLQLARTSSGTVQCPSCNRILYVS